MHQDRLAIDQLPCVMLCIGCDMK